MCNGYAGDAGQRDGTEALTGDVHATLLFIPKFRNDVPAKSLAVTYDGHVMGSVYHALSANSYHGRHSSWVNRQLRGAATKNLPPSLA